MDGPIGNRCLGSRSLPTIAAVPRPSQAIATSSDVRSTALSSTAGVCSQSLASPPAVNTLPSLRSILSVSVPSLHHVPKGARDMWARLVGELLSSLASDPADADSWSKFFMLAKCVLISPPRGGRNHWWDT